MKRLFFVNFIHRFSLLLTLMLWSQFSYSAEMPEHSRRNKARKTELKAKSQSSYTLYINPLGLLDGVFRGGGEVPIHRKMSLGSEIILNQGYIPEGTSYRLDGYSIHFLPSYFFRGYDKNSFYLTGGPGFGHVYIVSQEQNKNTHLSDHGRSKFFTFRAAAGYKWNIRHSDTSVAIEMGRMRHSLYDTKHSADTLALEKDFRENDFLTLKFGVKL